jgi:hypothetical protein
MLAVTRPSRAADAEVVVVDVAPGAAALDAPKLREQIGVELQASTVTPDDPRAASAKGTVTVDVDRATGELSVAYVARSAPVTRRVSLPAATDAARRAAVSLAGNLARDEASELAAELGQTKPAPPAKVVKPSAPLADTEEERVERRLRHLLEFYAERDRRNTKVVGWGLLAGGAVVAGGSVYAELTVPSRPAGYVSGVGFGLVGGGLWLVLDPPRSVYEPLLVRVREGERPVEIESAWARAASDEHAARRTRGVVAAVVAGGLTAAGSFVLANQSLKIGDDARRDTAAFLYGMGGVAIGASLWALLADGPIESSLRAYEQTSGRVVEAPAKAGLGGLRVGFLPGGAAMSFTASF